MDTDDEVNLIKDVRARSNACYKCGEMGHFQRVCKYDGDKPMDGLQEQDRSFDSYDPVMGKWMTYLVATTPITAKAMKSLYAELNRQKDLKRTYRQTYKDLQAIVTTTTDTSVTVLQPVAVTSSKVISNSQITKTTPAGQNKKTPDKGKVKPLGKIKKNVSKYPSIIDKECDKNEIHETKTSNQDINHMEKVIIGTEQGTTFPTKIGTSMCNALIDTGTTRSCISNKYYQNLLSTRIQHLKNISIRSATGSNLTPLGIINCSFELGKIRFNSDLIVCRNLT